MNRSLFAAALSTLALMATGAVCAQTFPSRSIRVIVPFAAGGAADNMARIASERVAQALGQSIAIENLTGAGGNVGALQVARAEPNG
ncbi:MAG: tripartite tricarboxylate transporter substrate binding protein, partial [Betaproteobacteria bacterium]|nr:tripartite tricarboxylate transporter substrate binding protein [Betaproteobacteria bacterium]